MIYLLVPLAFALCFSAKQKRLDIFVTIIIISWLVERLIWRVLFIHIMVLDVQVSPLVSAKCQTVEHESS